ncbi:CHAT domain-containing protein [Micromonospora chalcea]|uniref:CHAT domain-containing protein n=1 Tax=Micromonospora chalcea TaxID=1874 RepID=UPI001656A247|nr:CHAT domain-containing protein [Micromonospora chalcea]MBC8990890.1 CHAT domain-containing protein [Micromonospora chalcea]
MPTPDHLRDQVAKLQKEEADLSAKQSAERTAAAKDRDAAQRKREQAGRRTTSLATGQRLAREVVRAEQDAAKHETKAADFGKKAAAVAKKAATVAKSLRQAEESLRKTRDRDDQRRRREELAHARRVAEAARPAVSPRPVAPKPEPLRVAYLTASPEGEEHLRVDREVREVREAVRGALHRDLVTIEPWPAATFDDLFHALNNQRPHVIHFSGHSSSAGLFLDGTDTVTPDGIDVDFTVLARLLKGTDTPPTVLVLNSCESFEGAETLLDAVPVVVAMVDEISDMAAKAFAVKFYVAIASGQSLASALTQGQTAIEFLTGEGSRPDVLTRPGIDPAEVVLVTAPPD